MHTTDRLQKLRRSARSRRGRIQIAFAVALLLAISWKALAAGGYDVVAVVEGEDMQAPSGAYVASDSRASGGKYLRMLSEGTASATVTLDRDADNIGVRALGSDCRGLPRMKVLLDGKEVGTALASDEDFYYYNFPVAMRAGTHKVSVSFINDRYRRGVCDRNLYLDRVALSRAGTGATPVPTATVKPSPTPTPKPSPSAPPTGTGYQQPPVAALMDAGFENGLANWNIGGVGDVVPTIASDLVRSGSKSAKVILTGSQDRSELILGGTGTGNTDGTVRFREGDERFYAFSFNVRSMQYGRPGAHNLLMQFKSDGDGSPNFGLQLWDYAGDDGRSGGKGLWSHGPAMGGDRYLRPIAHGQWYDVVIHFKASRTGQGFYKVYLNGQLVDQRSGVSMIRPDRTYAYIKNGLYRNGGNIPGTSEIRLDAARLGTAWNQVSGQ